MLWDKDTHFAYLGDTALVSYRDNQSVETMAFSRQTAEAVMPKLMQDWDVNSLPEKGRSRSVVFAISAGCAANFSVPWHENLVNFGERQQQWLREAARLRYGALFDAWVIRAHVGGFLKYGLGVAYAPEVIRAIQSTQASIPSACVAPLWSFLPLATQLPNKGESLTITVEKDWLTIIQWSGQEVCGVDTMAWHGEWSSALALSVARWSMGTGLDQLPPCRAIVIAPYVAMDAPNFWSISDPEQANIQNLSSIRWLDTPMSSMYCALPSLSVAYVRLSSTKASIAVTAGCFAASVLVAATMIIQAFMLSAEALPVPEPTSSDVNTSKRVEAINKKVTKLNKPILPVVKAVYPAKEQGVILLSMAVELNNRVSLSGEAQTFDDMLAYIARLKKEALIARVILLNNKTVDKVLKASEGLGTGVGSLPPGVPMPMEMSTSMTPVVEKKITNHSSKIAFDLDVYIKE